VDKNYLISKKELEFSLIIRRVKVVRKCLMISIQIQKFFLVQMFYKRNFFEFLSNDILLNFLDEEFITIKI
jgi:hypothetical protein